jgi:hypothetical protein
MGRGLQDQRRLSFESSAPDVAATATTPAMQALIEASTAASEAQTAEASSVPANEADPTAIHGCESSTGDLVDSKDQATVLPAKQNPTLRENDEFGGASIDGGDLANLDPNDHARISDPIVRPAKKHTPVHASHNSNANTNTNTNTNDSHCFEHSDEDGNAKHHGSTPDNHITTKTTIRFSESILSRLFEPDRKQKPELWGFVRLVAPGPANQPPEGQYKWRSKDAVAAYCLKCRIGFTYTPGTSKTVSRHMIAYHGLKSGSNRCKNSKTTSNSKAAAHKFTSPPESQADAVTDARTQASMARDLAATAKNTTSSTSSIIPKHSGSTRKRHRPSAIVTTAIDNEIDSTKASVEADPSSTENAEGGSIDRDNESIARTSPPSPLEKSRLARYTPEQASNKKRRRDTEDQKWRKPQEEPSSPPKGRIEGGTKIRDKEVMDLLTTDDDDDDEDCEDEYLKGHGMNRKAVIAKALFRWWIESYQSLDCYFNYISHPVWGNKGATRSIFGRRTNSSSLFLGFCKTLDNSFELPEPSLMDSLATSSYERLQSEIKIHVSKLFPKDTSSGTSPSNSNVNESHEFFSASVRRIKVVRIVGHGIGEDIAEEDDGIGSKKHFEICDASFAGATGKGDDHLLVGRGEGKGIGTKHKDKTKGEHCLGGQENMPRGLEIEKKIFFPVRLTFCTPMFRMKSYVIAVIPEENESEKSHGENGRIGNKSNTDGAIVSPYSEAVDRALLVYGFPRDNLSNMVIRGSCQEVKAGVQASATTSERLCILDRLDAIFSKVLRSPTVLPIMVRELLRRNGLPEDVETHDSTQKPTLSDFSTVRAYETLLSSLPQIKATETVSCSVLSCVLDTITPFRDAIQILSEDLHPTIGLSIPVLRRVRDMLLRQQTKLREERKNVTTKASPEESGDDNDGETSIITTKPIPSDINGDMEGDQSVNDALNESLEYFHRSILGDFEKNFASVLNENPALMWTVPLDPRLIAMRGLSEREQNKAKSELIEEVAKVVQVIDRKVDRKERNQRQNTIASDDREQTASSQNTRMRYNSLASSTMGGIFWGEDTNSDPVTTTTSGGGGSSTHHPNHLPASVSRNAEEYATKNVGSYFNTVHSQRCVKDPLQWWKNNQDQFPELAMLARKWMSASAAYGRKNTRDNESASVIVPTSYSDTERNCRMIFLRDNIDLV